MLPGLKAKYLWMIAGFLLLWMPSFSLAADQCLSPSPYKQQSTELTNDQHRALSRIFKSLKGDWQGTSDTFFCASAIDPTDVETGHETVKARVEVDRQNNFTLTADFYSPSEHTSFSSSLSLDLGSDRLLVGPNAAALSELSQDTASFFFREVRPASQTSPVRTWDRFFTLKFSGNTFSVTGRIYVQDKLSSGYTWRFERP